MVVVSELMTPDPVVAAEGTPVAECAQLLARHDLHHLPIVDPDGRAVGVLTDTAVFSRGAPNAPDAWAPLDEADSWLLARELACPLELVAYASDPALPALRALLRAFLDIVVVVDPLGRPVGIVTEREALRFCAAHLPVAAWSTDLPPQPLPTVTWDAPVEHARALLADGPHVLVTRGGALRGVLGRPDLWRPPWLGAEHRCGDLVGAEPPVTLAGPAPLGRVARWMAASDLDCLPVVDADLRPVRLITRADLVRLALDHLEGASEPQPAPDGAARPP